ncbi:hypothetical protein BS78_K094100 [Paspalum vaginatum]|uniref:F-box protein AT5G49610-like beta-propeller domain-containing protein n=1 Tax=Paspalum vaginatum TaxID=158149 RepID=A0A9W7X8Y0_9POAL|nr:hypothetical protein BS78_K094100 [Paspalum vaginatum]
MEIGRPLRPPPHSRPPLSPLLWLRPPPFPRCWATTTSCARSSFRLGLPTSLLRAALVCRRWLCHASPTRPLLRRSATLNPPRILGAYLSTSVRPPSAPAVPTDQPGSRSSPPAARRAGSFFDTFKGSSATVRDSRGGRLLVSTFDDRHDSTRQVCSPLSPARDTTVVPPPPPPPPIELNDDDEECLIYHYSEFLPDDGDGRSYFCVVMGYSELQTTVYLYELRDSCVRFLILGYLSHRPPRRVENNHGGCIMLSQREGSGIYLIYVKESQLHIFCHRKGGDDPGNWFLVDHICLRQVCSNLDMVSWPSVDGFSAGVKICAVGDNAKFVLLEVSGYIVFVDITTRQAEKVYELTPEDKELVIVYPLMLIWPPVFPQLKESDDQMG